MFIRTMATLLLVFSCSAFSGGALAQPMQAGIVIVVSGEVLALQDGQPNRKLKRRSKFYAGETIVVKKNAKAQVRFMDSTILSLTSGTELRIDAFNYKNKDGEEDSNIVTLLKGGFRTITGAVAKRNPANHRVNTPVATIGVRGTNYSVAVDDSVYVGVWDGLVLVENDAGMLELGEAADYSFAEITTATEMPKGMVKPPSVLVETISSNTTDSATDDTGDESGAESVTALASVETDHDAAEFDSGDFDSGTDAFDYEEETKLGVFESGHDEDVVATVKATDARLTDAEEAGLDRVGIAMAPRLGHLFDGDASVDTSGNVIIRDDSLNPDTGLSKAIIRNDSASSAEVIMTSLIAGNSKEVNWGVWDAASGAQSAYMQTDPSDPRVKQTIDDRVMWMTVQATDADVVAGFTSGGTWSVVQQVDAVNDLGEWVNGSTFTFSTTLDLTNGSMTGTTLTADTLTDVWDVTFNSGAFNQGSFELSVDTSQSSLQRTPINATLTQESLNNGALFGIMTGDQGEAVAAMFSLTSQSGAHLDGQLLSTCSACPQ